eukprot:SAG11_NODE_38417_length_252_cov_1.000000_1_plen_83_part_11
MAIKEDTASQLRDLGTMRFLAESTRCKRTMVDTLAQARLLQHTRSSLRGEMVTDAVDRQIDAHSAKIDVKHTGSYEHQRGQVH